MIGSGVGLTSLTSAAIEKLPFAPHHYGELFRPRQIRQECAIGCVIGNFIKVARPPAGSSAVRVSRAATPSRRSRGRCAQEGEPFVEYGPTG